MARTKEMFIDFRRCKPLLSSSAAPAPNVIKGEPVAEVQQYKYLGIVLTMF